MCAQLLHVDELQLEKMFANINDDGNQVLSYEEFSSAPGLPFYSEVLDEGSTQVLFQVIDRDQDGVTSLEEFGVEARVRDHTSLDRDGSGDLDENELRAGKLFTEIDSDSSGGLSMPQTELKQRAHRWMLEQKLVRLPRPAHSSVTGQEHGHF